MSRWIVEPSLGLVLTWHRPRTAMHPRDAKVSAFYDQASKMVGEMIKSIVRRPRRAKGFEIMALVVVNFLMFLKQPQTHVMGQLAWRSSRFWSRTPKSHASNQALIKQSRFCRRREGCSRVGHHSFKPSGPENSRL
jgi:hypothetical protein